MPDNKWDVLIVGAGIVGLTSAFHLKRENPDLSVLVIDRAKTYAQGNTAKSAAGFRDLFSSETNFLLSSSTVAFLKSVQDSKAFDLGMQHVGYMFLLPAGDPRMDILQNLSRKTRVRFLDHDELSQYRFLNMTPSQDDSRIMGVPPIENAAIGENCGIIEPELVAEYYYKQCLTLGVEFMFGAEAHGFKLQPVDPLDYPGEPFVWQKKTLRSIETSKGELSAETFIIATDIWTTGLLDSTGIDSHIRPKKRQVFQTGGKAVEDVLYGWDGNSYGVIPFTILPAHGVFLRPAPKFRSFWVGVADDYSRDFSYTENPEAEREFYNYSIAPVITAYFSSLAEQKVTGMWAGYYAYNTIDRAPYIFRDLNIIVATGTSGSGILKSDAIGRVVEAAYSRREKANLYGGSSLDVSLLGLHNRKADREDMVL